MKRLECIPDTLIEKKHATACKAPTGQYRVICMDTTDGTFDVWTHGDYDSHDEAMAQAVNQADEPLNEGGQTVIKAYVFDSSGKVQGEAGSI